MGLTTGHDRVGCRSVDGDVNISLKTKKVRLETESDAPSIDAIKQAVLNAGFTPVKVTVLSDEGGEE